MRETIGGTWITQLVIVIMFVFSAFLALSINYSKAFRVKNQVISIIEKKEGISNSSIKMINNYLKNSGYGYVGRCGEGFIGVNIANNTNGSYEDAVANKNYNYCIKKIKSIAINFPNRAFYEVKLFFKFNLPVVGDIFNFEVDGQTKDIEYPIDIPSNNNINPSVSPPPAPPNTPPPQPDTPTPQPAPPAPAPSAPTPQPVSPAPPAPSAPTEKAVDLGLPDEAVVYLNVVSSSDKSVTLTANQRISNWKLDNNEKLSKVDVKAKQLTLNAEKRGDTKVCAYTDNNEYDCTNVKVKKKVIIVIGASQVRRMKGGFPYKGRKYKGVDSYKSGKFIYKTSNDTLIYIDNSGSKIDFQVGAGFDTAKSKMKNKKNTDYYILFPLPGNDIAQFKCDDIKISNNTIIGYADSFDEKIAGLNDEGYTVNGYVISVQPVEPGNPDASKKVVSNKNDNACKKTYRSNKKYYKFNQTMKSLAASASRANITYVETFTQIMDIQDNANGTYKYNITYDTDDGVHWDEKTTAAYVKMMLDPISEIK